MSSVDKRISSSGMDRKIEKKKWDLKKVTVITIVLLLVAFFFYSFIFADRKSSLNVERDKLNIYTVKKDSFQEFTQVNGTVQPIQTVYLDAIEGGVVDKVYLESGTRVEKGDTILKLSNSELRLKVLQQSSALYDQINQTRNSRLNIEQNTLSLKERLAEAESKFEITNANFQRQERLYEKGLSSEKKHLESKKEFEYQEKRYQLIYESYRQDSIKSSQQLKQIDESLDRMWRSLNAVENILERLVVTSPIEGQLSTVELHPGQSISAKERIGQIDILSDYKVRVNIDEYYLSRIFAGLKGTIDYNNKTHELEIAKIYPVVKDGKFQVDMEFTKKAPEALRRGQSLRIRLELGDTSEAVLLARGGFYQQTGGSWIYRVTDNGERAIKHDIQIGRQNPEYYEVLSGLKPGDKVITSSYDTYGNNEVLNLK